MSELRMWLFRIVVVSILCSVGEGLIPVGSMKRMGKLVCGLMMLWVMLSPLTKAGDYWEEFSISYPMGMEEQVKELERQTEETRKTIIEEKYEAYIMDKAKKLGVECTAEVGCRLGEEGLYLPEYARMTGRFSDVIQSRMTQLLEEELQLPVQRQEYIVEEAPT